MINDIICFVIVICLSIFLNNRYILNRSGKVIIKIISYYLIIINLLFFLDKYNIPSLFNNNNIDYQLWLNIIIDCLNTFIFGFAIILFIEALKVSLNNSKELNEKIKVSYKLLNSNSKFLKSTFLIQVSARKSFCIYAYGFNDVLYKNNIITKKAKKIEYELNHLFLKNTTIDLYLDFGKEKCKLTIEISRKNKKIIESFGGIDFDFD